MKTNRRNFIKLAGGSALAAIAAKQGFELVAKGEVGKREMKGIRWAMAINLKQLQENDGYKRCIEACHSLHNVPAVPNKNHEIKWIWKEAFHHAFIEMENPNLPEHVENLPVLLLCNHCANPACVSVCPTKATWKREDGIVMMDWHRCVGCRYCIAGCPYGSRSFNYEEPRQYINKLTNQFPARTRGVVEKCTFCAEFIDDGVYIRPPACVEASGGAIKFGNINDKSTEIYKVLHENFSLRRKPELGTEPEVYYLL
ncbi:MAG: hypothetical protein QG635_1958 [Bacteroidota bacterium]|nr:hypothetical protein [Bacteroidota bacterium]